MARFRLLKAHYLNVPGTEWEHKETSATGKQVRKIFEVPLYLDPDNPGDHTPMGSGQIIVSTKLDKAFPHDLVFIGPPTPEMEPLDDEAEAIIATFASRWNHPIETDDLYSDRLLRSLEAQVASLQSGQVVPPKADDRVAALEAQVKRLTELLEKSMAAPPTALAQPTARRQ